MSDLNAQPGLVSLAEALRSLTWSEMVKVSEYLAGEYPHLVKSDSLDRDGMAQVLNDMADDIAREAEQVASEKEPDNENWN